MRLVHSPASYYASAASEFKVGFEPTRQRELLGRMKQMGLDGFQDSRTTYVLGCNLGRRFLKVGEVDGDGQTLTFLIPKEYFKGLEVVVLGQGNWEAR